MVGRLEGGGRVVVRGCEGPVLLVAEHWRWRADWAAVAALRAERLFMRLQDGSGQRDRALTSIR